MGRQCLPRADASWPAAPASRATRRVRRRPRAAPRREPHQRPQLCLRGTKTSTPWSRGSSCSTPTRGGASPRRISSPASTGCEPHCRLSTRRPPPSPSWSWSRPSTATPRSTPLTLGTASTRSSSTSSPTGPTCWQRPGNPSWWAAASPGSVRCRSGRPPRLLRPLVSHDNEQTISARLPLYLVMAEALQAKGIVTGSGTTGLPHHHQEWREGRREPANVRLGSLPIRGRVVPGRAAAAPQASVAVAARRADLVDRHRPRRLLRAVQRGA